jgi:hypothetical protein
MLIHIENRICGRLPHMRYAVSFHIHEKIRIENTEHYVLKLLYLNIYQRQKN